MEGLLPAHPLLYAPPAAPAGLAGQGDPLRVASECLKAQLPLVQRHLQPPLNPRLLNSSNPSPRLSPTLGFHLLPPPPPFLEP